MNRSRPAAVLLASALAIAPLATSCSSDTSGDAAGSAAAPAASAPASPTASVDPGIPLPPDWPEAVPPFPNATLSRATVEPDGSASAVWMTTGAQTGALADYVAVLEAAGYSLDKDGTIDGIPTAELTGNGYSVVAQAVGLEGSTSVSIAATPQ